MNQTAAPMLSVDSVGDHFGLSRSWVFAQVRKGTLPKPVKLGKTCSRWPGGEIDAVIAARVAGQGDKELRALVAELMAARCSMGVALV